MKAKAFVFTAISLAILLSFGFQAQARTYLGVATAPVNPEVADHLKLDKGVGLTVVEVDPDSAASGKLETYDILYKFDDQILVSPRQLAVLVRSKSPGDKVEIALYRSGENMTKEIELGKAKDIPEQARQLLRIPQQRGLRHPGRKFRPMKPGVPQGLDDNFMENLQRKFQKRMQTFRNSFGDMDALLEELRDKMKSGGQKGSNIISEQHHSVDITRVENGMEFHYTRQDGDQHLEVIDKNGDILFDGPINTEEQMEDIPKEAKEFLDSIDTKVEYEPEEETQLIPSDAI